MATEPKLFHSYAHRACFSRVLHPVQSMRETDCMSNRCSYQSISLPPAEVIIIIITVTVLTPVKTSRPHSAVQQHTQYKLYNEAIARINTIKRTVHAYNAQTLKKKEKKKERSFTCTSHPVHCVCLLTPAHSGFQTERKRSKASARFANWAPSHGITPIPCTPGCSKNPQYSSQPVDQTHIYIYPLTA